MIEYELTDKEYLFWIPSQEIPKARAIPGSKLDKVRGCWVFPRTAAVRNSLQEAFGGKAKRRASVQPPNTQVSVPLIPYAKELETVQQELAARVVEIDKLRRELREQAERLENHQQAEVTAHETILSLREQVKQVHQTIDTVTQQNSATLEQNYKEELAAAREALVTFKKQYKQLYQEAELTAKQKIASLQEELKQVRRQLAEPRVEATFAQQFDKMIKQFALQAGNNRPGLQDLLERCPIDDYLPIRLKEELELMLYVHLGADIANSELTELIKLMKEDELLPRDELDLLYLVRNQRNVAAHPHRAKGTLQARGVLSLLAIAILWSTIGSQK